MPPKKTANSANGQLPVPVELIQRRIYLDRGHKVMFDADLSGLYEVSTKALNQAVKRNTGRFPKDFMFRLTSQEAKAMNRSQIVTGSHRARRGYALLSAQQRTRRTREYRHHASVRKAS